MEVALQEQKIKKLEREKALLEGESQQVHIQLQALQDQLSQQPPAGYSSGALEEEVARLRTDLEAALEQNEHLRRERKELL